MSTWAKRRCDRAELRRHRIHGSQYHERAYEERMNLNLSSSTTKVSSLLESMCVMTISFGSSIITERIQNPMMSSFGLNSFFHTCLVTSAGVLLQCGTLRKWND